MELELVPRAIVAGMMQGQLIGTGTVGPGGLLIQPGGVPPSRDVITQIWADVVKTYPYQSLQLEPSGRGGAFLGGSSEDLVVIQPPLLQVRASLSNELRGVGGAAEKIATVLQSAVHHLGGPPPVNLGVKIVYNAQAPGRDAAAFVRTELVKADEDIQALAGAMDFQTSLKVIMRGADVSYTLVIEPLQFDATKLYIDLDGQFPGLVDVTRIGDRVKQVDEFLRGPVKTFLDRRAREWQ